MSKIEWTEKTWNPVIGCTKVSPGCDNCYAEKVAYRLANMGHKQYVAVSELGTGDWLGTTFCDESALEIPLHWKKPRMIFVCSMGDLFHPAVEEAFIYEVLNVAATEKRHIFQFLTKRPKRMVEIYHRWQKWLEYSEAPENLWLGVTAENQEMGDKRIPILENIPTAVRFVSIEPMLGAVDLTNTTSGDVLCQLNWVIVGCESGPRRRECKLEWVRDIVRQCKAAGVAVFVKQLSINGKVSKNMAEWPEDLRIREYPKINGAQ